MDSEYPSCSAFVLIRTNGHKQPDAGGDPNLGPQPLTARQSEVVVLAAQGLSNKQIARRLDITEGTVKVHLHNVYARLCVRNRTALVGLMSNNRVDQLKRV